MSSGLAISLADRIDALLPQTQCRRCGYSGCRPYAEAIAAKEADIDQCPPGGERGIGRLARLLGVAPRPLNPVHGVTTPKAVAVIDESTCIGCAFCLPACPVDAIIGARKHLHTVVAAFCTGCELCIAPCPVDCIAMVPIPEQDGEDENVRTHRERLAADAARERHQFRLARIERDQKGQALPARNAVECAHSPSEPAAVSKQAAVLAAIERARSKSAATRPAASAPDEHDERSVPAAPHP
jgi:electron transport complex protein RnfB